MHTDCSVAETRTSLFSLGARRVAASRQSAAISPITLAHHFHRSHSSPASHLLRRFGHFPTLAHLRVFQMVRKSAKMWANLSKSGKISVHPATPLTAMPYPCVKVRKSQSFDSQLLTRISDFLS